MTFMTFFSLSPAEVGSWAPSDSVFERICWKRGDWGTINEGDRGSLKTYKFWLKKWRLIQRRSAWSHQIISSQIAIHQKMKISFALIIFSAIAGFADAISSKQRKSICARFNNANNFLDALEAKSKDEGIPVDKLVRSLPFDKLLAVRRWMNDGLEHGCDQHLKPAAVSCKRFTQKGRSVVCKHWIKKNDSFLSFTLQNYVSFTPRLSH